MLRPFASPVDRAIWAWLAAAITARAVGFVYLGYVRRQETPPYPSLADVAWLAMYGLMLAGLIELARRRARRLSLTLVLDAAVGVLAASALAVALLYRTVLSLAAAPGTPGEVVAVGLAYPVLDLMLLAVFRDIRGLKLDHSFVTGMDDDPCAAAIVESTINLAHSLGMHVVAEGVETAPVRDRLAELGCELAQGFLFSVPLPADDVDFAGTQAARPRRS